MQIEHDHTPSGCGDAPPTSSRSVEIERQPQERACGLNAQVDRQPGGAGAATAPVAISDDQRGRLRDHLNYIASRAHAAATRLDDGNLVFVGEALTDIGAKHQEAVAILSGSPSLDAQLARALDEVWIFAALWAQSHAQDRGGRIHQTHAEILARLHAAFISAHAAGLLPELPTARLPILLAEHGYDIEVLAARPATSTRGRGA